MRPATYCVWGPVEPITATRGTVFPVTRACENETAVAPLFNCLAQMPNLTQLWLIEPLEKGDNKNCRLSSLPCAGPSWCQQQLGCGGLPELFAIPSVEWLPYPRYPWHSRSAWAKAPLAFEQLRISNLLSKGGVTTGVSQSLCSFESQIYADPNLKSGKYAPVRLCSCDKYLLT